MRLKRSWAQGGNRGCPRLCLCPPEPGPTPVAPPFSSQARGLGARHQTPGERGLKVNGHELAPDGDWQAPGPIARAMAAPQVASRVSGCHPRAKERRRHRIKGQRTPLASGGRAGGGRVVPASTPAAKSCPRAQRRARSTLPPVQKRRGSLRGRASREHLAARPRTPSGTRHTRGPRRIQVRGVEGIGPRGVVVSSPYPGPQPPHLSNETCTSAALLGCWGILVSLPPSLRLSCQGERGKLIPQRGLRIEKPRVHPPCLPGAKGEVHKFLLRPGSHCLG